MVSISTEEFTHHLPARQKTIGDPEHYSIAVTQTTPHPLLAHTDKPLAVAEGGLPSVSRPPIAGSEAGQVDYLNAVHTQLGPRLSFWIYLLLADLDPDSWGQATSQNGLSDRDANTLGYFVSVGLTTSDGSPKPALAVWDGFRHP